jgi:hypothetical protein
MRLPAPKHNARQREAGNRVCAIRSPDRRQRGGSFRRRASPQRPRTRGQSGRYQPAQRPHVCRSPRQRQARLLRLVLSPSGVRAGREVTRVTIALCGRCWRVRRVGAAWAACDAVLRINPMQSRLPMNLSYRCGARTRRGSRCRSPAMPNGRCRLHGGKSPGAPKGNKNAFKHGRYSAKTSAARRKVATLLRTMRSLVERC